MLNDSTEKIDYIELKIYKYKTYEIKSNNKMQSTYLSNHSPNSSTTISNFNRIYLIRQPSAILGSVFTFNKIIYKTLPKPYSTECQQFSQESKFHSYRDCFEFCCYNQITKMIDEETNISNYLTLLSYTIIPLYH